MGWQARFTPQAWQNDYAIEVDPEGETRWDIDHEDVEKWLPEAKRYGADLDPLQDHPGAPQWVREWRGPFYIELIDPDGLAVGP